MTTQRSTSVAVRRLADKIRDTGEQGYTTFIFATVAAVAGGSGVASINWRGKSVVAGGHLASYTPSIGDRVICAYDGQQLVILGKVVGTP